VESNLAANPVPMIWGQQGDVSGVADGPDEMAVVVRPFESFDVFVVTHGKTLVRCAYLIVGDVGAAQDVVQIALVKVAKRWPSVVANGHPLPYARAAVVHAAISWRRRKWHGEVPNGALPDQAGADAISAVDNRDRLRRALAALPRRQRAAVVLRHYLDLDEAATAAALGCSVGTVKSQTAKGLARLRQSLESDLTTLTTARTNPTNRSTR
jgi:RNA polymerase sigma-70 factor (sigma-E family)